MLAWAFFAGAIWPALALHFLQKRSLLPSSRKRAPNRVAAPHDVQTYFTVRKLDRHFFAEHAALRVLLAAADVLLDAVHAFDDGLAGRAIDLEHLALLAADRCRRLLRRVSSSDE